MEPFAMKSQSCNFLIGVATTAAFEHSLSVIEELLIHLMHQLFGWNDSELLFPHLHLCIYCSSPCPEPMILNCSFLICTSVSTAAVPASTAAIPAQNQWLWTALSSFVPLHLLQQSLPRTSDSELLFPPLYLCIYCSNPCPEPVTLNCSFLLCTSASTAAVPA